MGFHDLGNMGSADVTSKKLTVLLKRTTWDQFSKQFSVQIGELQKPTIALLQDAIKTDRDVKLKKEADEFDNFFSKVEDIIASSLLMDQEADAKPATIDEKTILALLTSTPISIRDLITKLGITDMLDARYLQMKLQALEKNLLLTVELRQGKKYYCRKDVIASGVPLDRKEAEEEVEIEELRGKGLERKVIPTQSITATNDRKTSRTEVGFILKDGSNEAEQASMLDDFNAAKIAVSEAKAALAWAKHAYNAAVAAKKVEAKAAKQPGQAAPAPDLSGVEANEGAVLKSAQANLDEKNEAMNEKAAALKNAQERRDRRRLKRL